MAASALGVDVTAVIALFSVAGLAVSLALQNTLANLAGGIMLLVSHPFEAGDYIESDSVQGTVTGTDLVYTAVTTADNKAIFIPNSQLAGAKIINYNRLGRRRIDATYSASYDAPTAVVKTALQEAVDRFPQLLDDPKPEDLPLPVWRQCHHLFGAGLGGQQGLLERLLWPAGGGAGDLCRPRGGDDL